MPQPLQRERRAGTSVSPDPAARSRGSRAPPGARSPHNRRLRRPGDRVAQARRHATDACRLGVLVDELDVAAARQDTVDDPEVIVRLLWDVPPIDRTLTHLRMRRRHGYLVGAVLALLLAALALRWGPAVTFSAALAVPAVDAWLSPLLPRITTSEITIDVAGRPLRADVYRPATPRAGIVLVHGLSRAGRRHPELVRLARLLAERGQLVLVPQLDGLAAFRLSGTEVGEIRASADHLARLTASIGIVGFSFGAGPALLAAADVPRVDLVGSFGGYADLRHVIAYITTGAHGHGGRRYVTRQEEYNRWKLLALLVGFVDDEHDVRILGAMAERKLADPGSDTGPLERDLGAAGRAVLALVTNRHEDAVVPLLTALPLSARRALEQLSPLAAVPRISGRLLIAHGMGDDSIPFTESLRLAEAAGERARLAVLRTFHHTGAQPFWRSFADRTQDAVGLVRLADDLLATR